MAALLYLHGRGRIDFAINEQVGSLWFFHNLMPCPVCKGVCRCGHSDAAEQSTVSEHVAAVIDPEQYDRSEERFTSSLERVGVSFDSEPMVDVTTALEVAARADRLAQLRPARRTIVLVEPKNPERTLEPGEWRREVSSRVSRYRARRRPRIERSRSLSLNFEPAPPSSSASALPAKKEIAPAAAAPAVDPAASPKTGDLMAMQIEAYGIERYWPKIAPRNENPFWKRSAQAFEPAAATNFEAIPDSGGSPAISQQFDGSTVSDRTSELTQAMSDDEAGGYERKVIEFPAALEPAQQANTGPSWSDTSAELVAAAPILEYGEELAEPMVASPRVFEEEEIGKAEFAARAEASVEPAPPMATVELPAMPKSSPAQPEIRIFAPIAPIYLRAITEVADAFISMSGFLLFSSILMWAGAMPQGRGFMMLAALLPGFFWSLYQYLFLVNTGSTPGMRLTGLKLAEFDGNVVSRSRRRARVLSMSVSTLAAGLGFVWALLDIDHLCWHDRASRTFLTRKI